MSTTSTEAFTATIQPHFARLYRLAYRLTGTKADAEDLVQDVLTKLLQRRDELSSIRELSPWLGRVVYNQFIDSKRRYGRQALLLVGDLETELAHGLGTPAIADTASEPLNAAELSDQHKALTRALTRLSEEHRIVLLMHDAEGYKLAEINELTGIPVGTVKSRLHRARARMRELLGTSKPPSDQPQSAAAKITGTFSADSTCKRVDGVGNDAL